MPTELTPLTDTELDAIDAAAKAATPGPYEHYHRGHPSMGWDFEVADESKKDGIRSGSRGMLDREEDAAYFASLDPQTVRRIVAQARRSTEIDRLTAENARLSLLLNEHELRKQMQSDVAKYAAALDRLGGEGTVGK